MSSNPQLSMAGSEAYNKLAVHVRKFGRNYDVLVEMMVYAEQHSVQENRNELEAVLCYLHYNTCRAAKCATSRNEQLGIIATSILVKVLALVETLRGHAICFTQHSGSTMVWAHDRKDWRRSRTFQARGCAEVEWSTHTKKGLHSRAKVHHHLRPLESTEKTMCNILATHIRWGLSDSLLLEYATSEMFQHVI